MAGAPRRESIRSTATALRVYASRVRTRDNPAKLSRRSRSDGRDVADASTSEARFSLPAQRRWAKPSFNHTSTVRPPSAATRACTDSWGSILSSSPRRSRAP